MRKRLHKRSVELTLHQLQLIAYSHKLGEHIRGLVSAFSVGTEYFPRGGNLESSYLNQVINQLHLLNVLFGILTYDL